MVGETGFEPATPWSQTRCATGLRYSPIRGTISKNPMILQNKNALLSVILILFKISGQNRVQKVGIFQTQSV